MKILRGAMLIISVVILWKIFLNFYKIDPIILFENNGQISNFPNLFDEDFILKLDSSMENKTKNFDLIEDYTKLGASLVRYNILLVNDVRVSQDWPNKLEKIFHTGYADFSFGTQDDSQKISVDYGKNKVLGKNLNLEDIKNVLHEKLGSISSSELYWHNVLKDKDKYGDLLRNGIQYYGGVTVEFELTFFQKFSLLVLSLILVLGFLKLLSESRNFILSGLNNI